MNQETQERRERGDRWGWANAHAIKIEHDQEVTLILTAAHYAHDSRWRLHHEKH